MSPGSSAVVTPANTAHLCDHAHASKSVLCGCRSFSKRTTGRWWLRVLVAPPRSKRVWRPLSGHQAPPPWEHSTAQRQHALRHKSVLCGCRSFSTLTTGQWWLRVLVSPPRPKRVWRPLSGDQRTGCRLHDSRVNAGQLKEPLSGRNGSRNYQNFPKPPLKRLKLSVAWLNPSRRLGLWAWLRLESRACQRTREKVAFW